MPNYLDSGVRTLKYIFTRSRRKAWISLTGFTRARYHPRSCSNNSFSTGHKCRSSKVNIRLSIDGFHDRERFYRRRTRTCRLLPVFSVFNGPSARPDLRRSSLPRAAKLPSTRGKDKRHREREIERNCDFTSILRVCLFTRSTLVSRQEPNAHFRLRVCRSLDRISHLITRKSIPTTTRREGRWNENVVTVLRRGQRIAAQRRRPRTLPGITFTMTTPVRHSLLEVRVRRAPDAQLWNVIKRRDSAAKTAETAWWMMKISEALRKKRACSRGAAPAVVGIFARSLW